MEATPNNSLMEFFIQQMVEPVTNALKTKNLEPAEQFRAVLQTKIQGIREDLIEEINRAYDVTLKSATKTETDDKEVEKDVAEVLDNLLEKVNLMEELRCRPVSVSPPFSMSDLFEHIQSRTVDFNMEKSPSPQADGMSVTEMVLLNTLQSDTTTETESAIEQNDTIMSDDSKSRSTSPEMSSSILRSMFPAKAELPSPVSSDDSKGMPSRKRVKRSLEDTVQMLSDDIKKVPKEDSLSPSPPAPQTSLPHSRLQFVLPQVPVQFSNPVMQRWLGPPFPNPVYLNALNMFHAPKTSEEQLAALMKISMHAANFIRPNGPQQTAVPDQTPTELDSEDIKIDVESDDGEVEVSPSPSTGDIAENDSSSSSSGASLTSPTCADGESAAEKPFICMHNNCGKRFANKFLLKKHMFIHTGLRPHTCPHCHKKFNRKDNLLRHKKTHSPGGGHAEHVLPKVHFPSLPQLPNLHNMALAQGFNQFHVLKMSLENGAPAVRSLS